LSGRGLTHEGKIMEGNKHSLYMAFKNNKMMCDIKR
jgi:hypothetical protein